jgi:hypothetical protein
MSFESAVTWFVRNGGRRISARQTIGGAMILVYDTSVVRTDQ